MHSKPHNDNVHLQPKVQQIRTQNLTGTFLCNHFFCYTIQDKMLGNQNLPLVESFPWFIFDQLTNYLVALNAFSNQLD